MSTVEEQRERSIPIVPAGPLSELLANLLSAPPDPTAADTAAAAGEIAETVADPLGDDDLQLALYVAYELHYRSFPGVHPAWEWSPALLALRARLEEAFFGALDEALPPAPADPWHGRRPRPR